MFRWYVINTYSGHEKKVKQNLEHRVASLNQTRSVRQVVVPTETVQEMKDNQKVSVEKRTMPGYVLVNMDLNEDSWQVVKGTPGVTGFVGASNEPIPLTQAEVDRLLHREVAVRAPSRAQFAIGESVKVISGPLSDFSGEISEINEDAAKLKVLVSIFGRETPVEVGYDQVKKIYAAATLTRALEWPRKSSPRSSCRRPEARPRRRRRSAPRWASTASTSWSSSRRSTPRRRTTWARRSPSSSPSTRTARSPSSRRRRRPRS